MISCILLSAGLSSRFGTPKALAQLTPTICVIDSLQKELLQAHVDEIVVVLGEHSEQIQPRIHSDARIRVVYNKNYFLGQTSSFKIGLSSVSASMDAFFLLPVDFPFLDRSIFDLMIQKFYASNSKILVPCYQGRKGHPPLFHATLKEYFLNLKDTSGLNTIQHAFEQEMELVSFSNPAVVQSFNTMEEWDLLKKSAHGSI